MHTYTLCISAFLHKYLLAYNIYAMHSYIPAYINTCKHVCIEPYIISDIPYIWNFGNMEILEIWKFWILKLCMFVGRHV